MGPKGEGGAGARELVRGHYRAMKWSIYKNLPIPRGLKTAAFTDASLRKMNDFISVERASLWGRCAGMARVGAGEWGWWAQRARVWGGYNRVAERSSRGIEIVHL